MRLGDLDALKKAIDDYAEKRQDTLLWQADIEELIDNAPTVEIPVARWDCYCEGQKVGYEKALSERPQGEIKKYKPLELDYNVQCAVENLRAAYWNNEPEKDAKNFTEAEDIIISAICHHGYTVCKQPQGEWIPICEKLPEASRWYLVYTKYDDVMTDFFMDDGFMKGDDIIAWQPLPEPYKAGGKEE